MLGIRFESVPHSKKYDSIQRSEPARQKRPLLKEAEALKSVVSLSGTALPYVCSKLRIYLADMIDQPINN